MTIELTAEDYLDKEFPKGETKLRGQAMVLLVLAKMQGRIDALKEVKNVLKEFGNNWEVAEEMTDGFEYNQFKNICLFKELQQKISELNSRVGSDEEQKQISKKNLFFLAKQPDTNDKKLRGGE